MRQTSFAGLEYAGKKRRTRREKFLGEMDRAVPWPRLIALIEPHHPHYPRSGKVGRPPIGVARMLRMYFLQQWCSVSDEGLEAREGTLVDATIIAALRSTRNEHKARDPEMHQTKKGNQWHFGMKAHIGVDAESGLVHSMHATAANGSGVAHTHELLHGEEVRVHADAGYTGVDKRAEIAKAQAEGTIRTDIDWHVATKRGLIKAMPEGAYKELTVLMERKKAQIRARVEHSFHVIKNLFGYKKVSYRGLRKNGARLHAQFALANLVLAKRRLLDDANQGIGAS